MTYVDVSLNNTDKYLRESSFNMTRGGGDEDIETRSLEF